MTFHHYGQMWAHIRAANSIRRLYDDDKPKFRRRCYEYISTSDHEVIWMFTYIHLPHRRTAARVLVCHYGIPTIASPFHCVISFFLYTVNEPHHHDRNVACESNDIKVCSPQQLLTHYSSTKVSTWLTNIGILLNSTNPHIS